MVWHAKELFYNTKFQNEFYCIERGNDSEIKENNTDYYQVTVYDKSEGEYK